MNEFNRCRVPTGLSAHRCAKGRDHWIGLAINIPITTSTACPVRGDLADGVQEVAGEAVLLEHSFADFVGRSLREQAKSYGAEELDHGRDGTLERWEECTDGSVRDA